MSIAAQAWLARLPLDCGVNLAAFRVLQLLADGHNAETGIVWRTPERMAAELRTSKRTVQRALKDLRVLGFIREGDQRVLSHLDPRYRPKVYELALEFWKPATEQPQLAGVTTGVTPDGLVDNSAPGVTTVVTPGDPGVTDTPHPGVTTVVTLRTGSESSRASTQTATDRASGRAVDNAQCDDGSTRHAFSRKTGRCVYCGAVRAAG